MASLQILPNIYSKRMQDGYIRLLELLPGRSEDLITCRLIETQIDSAPKYEALSYVWGDPNNRVEVQCNDSMVPVTVNLADALERLRLPLTSRLLWADAICINQNDHAEKSHQVHLMGKIYSRAESVQIWLGKSRIEIPKRVTELLGQIHAYLERAHHWGLQNWSTIKPYSTNPDDESRILGDSISWSALAELFSSSWFSRIWCVQEIILARTATVMFGEVDIPWDDIKMIAVELYRAGAANDVEAPAYVKAVDYFKACSVIQMKVEPTQTLENVLQKFRSHLATDGRDKIFGILGMTDKEQWDSWLQIDYTKPTEELYRSVAAISIKRRESLAIFSFVEHGSVFEPGPEIPSSWVPRWDKPKDTISILRDPLEPHWSACGRRTIPNQKSTNCKCLKLDGVILDVVTRADVIMDKSMLSIIDPQPNSHPILNLWKEILPYEMVPSAMKKAVISLSHTLTLGFDIDMECDISDCNPEDLEEQERYSRDFLPYIQRLFEISGHDKIPDVSGVHDNIPGTWKNYSSCISPVCDQRRIFYTKSGRYGIGPACMEQGDVVALLWGGRAPYMLRQCKRGTACDHGEQGNAELANEFYFLGECYVDELMSGDFADSSSIEECEIILI